MSAPVDGPDAGHVPDDGWRVEINNDEDPDQLTTKSDLYAICEKRRAPYRYVFAAEGVPDGTQRTVKARCPKHQTAIGGGIEVIAPYKASMLVNSTFRDEAGQRTAWVGTVDNYATPDGKKRKFRVTAICR